MKTILLIAGILFTGGSFAQTKDIKLKKGQTITVTSTVTQNLEMGMGMSMTSGSNSTHVIKVDGEDGNNYNISATLTKVKSNTSAMGQETNYDSEDATSSDSELAAIFEKSLNVTESSLLDKTSGIAKSTKPEVIKEVGEDEDDFLKDMMGGASSNDNNGIISSAFFTAAAGKKVGDAWIDSSTANGFRNVNNYRIASINGDVIIVNLAGTISGSQQVETQGMQIDITMNTKNKGTIEINKNSLQVLMRTVEADITSSMDMMGQAMDMTGTVKTITIYK